MYPLGFADWVSVSVFAWVVAITAGVIFAAFTIRGFPQVRTTWKEASLLKLVSLWAAAAAAIVEEAFFRQFLMNTLAEAGSGILVQVLTSANSGIRLSTNVETEIETLLNTRSRTVVELKPPRSLKNQKLLMNRMGCGAPKQCTIEFGPNAIASSRSV